MPRGDGKSFVGRMEYLEAFDKFVNASVFDLKGQVMLVVGEEGMGKTALLQAMAKRAGEQNHIVALTEVDKRDPEFAEQIYPLIAQIDAEQKLKLGSKSDWLKTGLIGFSTVVGVTLTGPAGAMAGGVAALGGLLSEIRDRHKAGGLSPQTLAEIFHEALSSRDKKMDSDERIVIFLDPEKESPTGIVPLLRRIGAKVIPSRVRFILAQRPKDDVIQAYEKRELRDICLEPMRLKKLPEEEEIKFIKAHDKAERFSVEVIAAIRARFGGWPLLLELAIEDLLKIAGGITLEHVQALPSDRYGFWERRYRDIKNENALRLVQTACLLPHPYPADRLTRFGGLTPSSVVAAMNDSSVWDLLEKTTYLETHSQSLWRDCPYPKHATAKDFVNGELEKFEELKKDLLDRIVSEYKATLGEDLSGGNVEKDALIYLPSYLLESGQRGEFLSEVDRLGNTKSRYGLVDSWLSDLLISLEIYEELGSKEGIAVQYSNLGNVYQIRGELDRALEMYEEALAINEKLGQKEFMTVQYNNMGNVYQIRGDLDKAREMYEKALAINEELGSKEGMAVQYNNMGIVYQIRGNLDKAREMYGKALIINEELGRKEGMAVQYGNIGRLYRIHGELDRALEMYEKALATNEELGHKEGMATCYGNMGIVYKIREDLDRALEMYRKSLAIDEELGFKEGIANDYGNIGIVYAIRGDLDKALEMYGKSLIINEELGRKEGMANQYGNMGIVYAIRGDLDKALEMYGKSLAINEELGRKEGMALDYSNMGDVYQVRGESDKALEMYSKALAINEELGQKGMNV
jgi:tetratricopeptide (TPR) repeat protein